jgi:hypothetical protein
MSGVILRRSNLGSEGIERVASKDFVEKLFLNSFIW